MTTQVVKNGPAQIAFGLVLFLILACLPSASHAEVPQGASRVMIDNGGTKIAFYVIPPSGSGDAPSIVLDAGGGGDASYWADLAPKIAERTGARVITYDRAGFGASDERPGPFRLEDAVDDLSHGLEVLGATRDVILVPHSFGGKIATSLARKHPDWVSGAVLVDASIPQFFTEDVLRRQAEAYAPVIEQMKGMKKQTKQTRSQLAFFDSFVEMARAFHLVTWPKAIPCTVILAEHTPFADAPVDAQMWRDAQALFAQEAGNRGLIVATGSSHDVANDRPDLIIQAVAEMAARIR